MTEKTQINIRVPIDVKAWLAARAAANTRTVCGEILAILKDAKGGETKSKQASKQKEAGNGNL